jgi:putative transposase
VINRGNARAEFFHKDEDFSAFLRIMAEAAIRVPMRVVAYCLMPNHFHLVLWPSGDGDLSHWMHWLLTTHVRRHQRHYGHSGHVWQGRLKRSRSSRTSTWGGHPVGVLIIPIAMS